MAPKKRGTNSKYDTQAEREAARRTSNRIAQRRFRARKKLAAKTREHSDEALSIHEDPSPRFRVELLFKRLEKVAHEFVKITQDTTDSSVIQYMEEQRPFLQTIVELLGGIQLNGWEKSTHTTGSPENQGFVSVPSSPTPASVCPDDETSCHQMSEPLPMALVEFMKEMCKQMNQIVPKNAPRTNSWQERSSMLGRASMDTVVMHPSEQYC